MMPTNAPDKRAKSKDTSKQKVWSAPRHLAGLSLGRLVRCYEKDKEAVTEAIFKMLESDPSAARVRYLSAYPLHLSIESNLPFDIIKAIYEAFPEAARTEDVEGTALHSACECSTSSEVMSLLLREYPEALSQTNIEGMTPLHIACCFNKPFEVVSLILEGYPEAIKMKDRKGSTPLHYCAGYFEVASLVLETYPDAISMKDHHGMTPLHNSCTKLVLKEVVALFIEKYPQAVELKDRRGNTPLHLASMHNASIQILTLLIEKYSKAVDMENYEGKLPIELLSASGGSRDGMMILNSITGLVKDVVDIPLATQIMRYFIILKWWAGVLLVLDLYPPIVESFKDMPLSVTPDLLCLMGIRCKMFTMCNMLSNRHDILKVD